MSFIPIDVEGNEEFKNFIPKFINMLCENSENNCSDIFKLFESYVKSKDIEQKIIAEGFVVPKAFIISPTMKCNLDCQGCYAKEYPKDAELSLEEINRVINEAKEMGVFTFVISGGEPFIKKGLIDILTRHEDVLFWIFTNGTLLTETLAESLKKRKTIFTFFSIEGLRKETDEWRGSGVYDKVITAMELFKRKNIPFGFSTTVTKKNINVISQEEYLEKMAEKGCKVGIYLDYNHVNNDLENIYSCGINEKLLLNGIIEKYNEKSGMALIYQAAWEEMAGKCCCAGAGILHINSQGFVEPCPILKTPGENIREKSLKDILRAETFKKIMGKGNSGKDGFHKCILTN